MNIYAHHGFEEFVVACGYQANVIKDYFNNFYYNNSDYTISLKEGKRTIINLVAPNWTVSLVDTGINTMTGGRLLRLKEWLGEDTFMVTYGDGLADIDINKLVAFHRSHGKLATVTAVQPPARFGSLVLDGNAVRSFAEKVTRSEAWINGGFFVFDPAVLEYIAGDTMPLEQEPLINLARDGQLMAYRHEGFWRPMDTLRDRNYLEELWATGKAPWKVSA
jgi:glucose-1-phosphate cytidylyltransferase